MASAGPRATPDETLGFECTELEDEREAEWLCAASRVPVAVRALDG